MKSHPICRNTLRRLAATAPILFLAAMISSAQGLVKIVDNAPGYFGSDIELLPSGNYRLASTFNTGFSLGNRTTRHHLADMTPDGQILQSQEYNFIPDFSWWLRDNTFLVIEAYPAGGDSAYQFTRRDAQNNVLWTQIATVPSGAEYVEWKSAELNGNGECLVMGVWVDYDGVSAMVECRAVFVKFAPNSDVIWQTNHQLTPVGAYFDEPALRLRSTGDGGCVVLLRQLGTLSTVLLLRLNADGSLSWVADTGESNINYIALTPDDGCVLLNDEVMKYDENGQLSWSLNPFDSVGVSLGSGILGSACSVNETGEIHVLSSQWFGPNAGLRYFALKIDTTGNILWWKTYNNFMASQGYLVIKDGKQTPDGDILWTGKVFNANNDCPYLIRMDSNGVIFTNHLAGKLAFDASNDCVVQGNEPGMPGWLLKLESGGLTRYGSTDAAGNFYFSDVDTGALALSHFVQNYLWEGCSPVVNAIMPPDSSDYTLNLDVPVRAVGDCPVMTVDLAAPRLRRCFDNIYALKCCNEGNQTATDAFVEVYLPQHLLLQSASHPYTADGNKLTFQLGSVDPFECIDIQFVVNPDCDSTVLGQAVCVSAQVFPDSICAPPPGWSGALVEVSAACDGDSVRFFIQNTGTAPMGGPLDFVIIDDHVMTKEGIFTLDDGEEHVESFFADGSTYRLEAEQEPNAPGAFYPSISVEGCVSGPGNPFTTGFVVQWPNENGSPFSDRDCHELINSYDPNDKQAAPQGVGDEHFIEPNTPIEYLIQFQNTGTDTAFTVVLRDTLSPSLDPGSIYPGASSHAYTWNLSGQGILTFTFENILLPDSNANEPASQGFVQFFIRQQPGLSDGTAIENRAGIYFDFNEPVVTNTVFHTVIRDFVPSVGVVNPNGFLNNTLKISPNPATGTVWASLENETWRGGRLTLSDALGRRVREFETAGALCEIRREGLPAGVYMLHWRGSAGQIFSGKIIWK